jgi:hypothetical protein
MYSALCTAVWAYGGVAGEAASSVSAELLARIVTERHDPRHGLFKYNFYELWRSGSDICLSGPSRDVDFRHHRLDRVSPDALGMNSNRSC